MDADLVGLRSELHQAVDATFERFQKRDEKGRMGMSQKGLTITHLDELAAPWEYRWPKDRETYTEGNWYDVSWATGATKVLLARCQRRAWGRERGRVVVFGQSGPEDSKTYYPWTEFVEADDGRYVADIPDPSAPRSLLKDKEPIPSELEGATIRRNDDVFESVENGPSLRLVVAPEDEEKMIRHGHWVASLRGRIR